MRFRVVYAQTQVLFAFKDTKLKVSELCKYLGDHLSSVTGADVVITQLKCGGFIVPNHDVIEDILRDDDTLEVIDMATFMKREYECCGRVEVSVQRRDLNDNILRKLYVGYNQTKQIYIAFLVGNELQRLEILKKSDILSFSRENSQVITIFNASSSVEDDLTKECKALVQIKTPKHGETTCSLILSLVTSTDPRPQVTEVEVLVGNNIKLGESKVVQSAIENWLSKELEVELPESKITGNGLPDVITPCTPTGDGNKEPPVSVQGTLKMTQVPINGKLQVTARQSYCSSGTIYVSYVADFLVVNGDRTVNIPKLKSEYLDSNGKWIEFEKTAIALNSSRHYSSHVDFGPNATYEISLLAELENFPGPQTSSPNRGPPSLPCPLKIRFTLTHSDGLSNVIEVEQVNPELPLKTREEGDIFWMNCDSAPTLTRHVFKIRKEEYSEEEYFSVYYKGSSSKYYYFQDLYTLAWNAKKENASEFLVEDLSYDEDSYTDVTQKVYALVDLERVYVYGFKVDMTTKSHSNCQSFKLPPLKLKHE